MAFQRILPIAVDFIGDGTSTFKFSLLTHPVCFAPPNGAGGQPSQVSTAFSISLANLPSSIVNGSTSGGHGVSSMSVSIAGEVTVNFSSAPNNTSLYTFYGNLVY